MKKCMTTINLIEVNPQTKEIHRKKPALQRQLFLRLPLIQSQTTPLESCDADVDNSEPRLSANPLLNTETRGGVALRLFQSIGQKK